MVRTICFTLLAFSFSTITQADDIKPEKVWKGAVQLATSFKGPQREKCVPITVVQDQAAYETFVAEIPKKEVSPTNPAPDSDDPLLKLPEIDFDKNTLVVLRTPNLDGLTVKSIIQGEEHTTITVEYLPEISARPIGTGSYTALLLPKQKQEIKLIVKK